MQGRRVTQHCPGEDADPHRKKTSPLRAPLGHCNSLSADSEEGPSTEWPPKSGDDENHSEGACSPSSPVTSSFLFEANTFACAVGLSRGTPSGSARDLNGRDQVARWCHVYPRKNPARTRFKMSNKKKCNRSKNTSSETRAPFWSESSSCRAASNSDRWFGSSWRCQLVNILMARTLLQNCNRLTCRAMAPTCVFNFVLSQTQGVDAFRADAHGDSDTELHNSRTEKWE